MNWKEIQEAGMQEAYDRIAGLSKPELLKKLETSPSYELFVVIAKQRYFNEALWPLWKLIKNSPGQSNELTRYHAAGALFEIVYDSTWLGTNQPKLRKAIQWDHQGEEVRQEALMDLLYVFPHIDQNDGWSQLSYPMTPNKVWRKEPEGEKFHEYIDGLVELMSPGYLEGEWIKKDETVDDRDDSGIYVSLSKRRKGEQEICSGSEASVNSYSVQSFARHTDTYLGMKNDRKLRMIKEEKNSLIAIHIQFKAEPEMKDQIHQYHDEFLTQFN